MKRLNIYVDTSVIGGCVDDEFKEWSNGLLMDFRNGLYVPVLSELTVQEIEPAPSSVQNIFQEFLVHADVVLALTKEMSDLAECYINREIVTPKFRDDARHIAIATVAGVDLVVSWNFKHIVHFDKIKRFNAVNLEQGYRTIDIYSPREVTSYGIQGC